jgi:tocopherol cyclase
MHTNHFATDTSASIIASVAIIPWLGSAFRGYLVGFKHSGKLHKFTTYNRSKEQLLKVDDTHVTWNLTGPDGRLEIKAERAAGGLLHAPLRSAMHKRVEETMLATVQVKHFDNAGQVIFDDVGTCAAMEVFGDLDRLLAI